MSANVHFFLTVSKIPAEREDAITAAIAKVLDAKRLRSDVRGPFPLEDPPGIAWTSNPSLPLIISGAYRWTPEVDKALAVAVRKASGGKAKVVATWIYDELRSTFKDTLRTMRRLFGKRDAPPRPASPKVNAAALESRWSDLEQIFGPLKSVASLDKKGTLLLGRGTVTVGKDRAPAFVTCGLSLMGHDVEFYVVPATASDERFAQTFLKKAVEERRAEAPISSKSWRSGRATFSVGKIAGHALQALSDPHLALPRKAGPTALVPLTSVTSALARKRVDGNSFLAANRLGKHYRWFGRVRDPNNADASQLLTAKAAAPSARPRAKTQNATRRFELVEGKSSKFWEVGLQGASVVVTFGRIGTSGQTKPKKLGSPAAAQTELAKLIAEKTRKGYREVR